MTWIANGEAGSSVRTKLNTIPNDGTNFTGPQLLATSSPSGVASVSFTNISQAYSNLLVMVYGRSSAAGAGATQVTAQFNADTAANYDHQYGYANAGGTFGGNTGTGDTSAIMGQIGTAGDAANYPGSFMAFIPAYTGTTFYKQVSFVGGFPFAAAIATNMYNTNGTAWWRSTAAITRMDLIISGGNYAAGTLITLYGL